MKMVVAGLALILGAAGCAEAIGAGEENTTESEANAQTLSGERAGRALPPPFADEEATLDADIGDDSIDSVGASDAENARCMIETGGDTYDGPCVFDSDTGGSFSVSRADESEIIPGRIFISVSVLEPGIADVRGLTTDGINSRWGEARRSSENRACWVGSDFRICAY